MSCDQLIAAYEKAGYEVFHHEYTDEDEYSKSERNGVCYVCATDPDGDENIYFEFFETPADAEAYADSREWNAVLWLYSAVNAQPTWVHTKTYDVIEYEYTDKETLEPFDELISQ